MELVELRELMDPSSAVLHMETLAILHVSSHIWGLDGFLSAGCLLRGVKDKMPSDPDPPVSTLLLLGLFYDNNSHLLTSSPLHVLPPCLSPYALSTSV